jgi:hypothetical protein
LLVINLFFIIIVYQLGQIWTITQVVFSIIGFALFFLSVPTIFRRTKK